MKATELRIGNLVEWYGIKEVDSIIRSANGSHKIIVCEKKESRVSICESTLIEYLQLIPLTKEWLLKLGFERSGLYHVKNQVYIYNEYGFTTTVFEYRYNYTSRPIEYLHELQNLYFALTGEELRV